eukprot:6386186-Amphidinium_carterae.1
MEDGVRYGALVRGGRALVADGPGLYIAAKLVSVTEAAAGVMHKQAVDAGDPSLPLLSGCFGVFLQPLFKA